MRYYKWGGIILLLWLCLALETGPAVQGKTAQIVVNLPSRTLAYYENQQLIKEYPVAIGRASTPTPLGEYTVIYKEVNPSWYPPESPGVVVGSGPGNPLGYRWLGFAGNYGIHGTNAPWSIGSVISNGCIRMAEDDVEELFPLVPEGTSVRITYDRIGMPVDEDGWVSIALYPDVYGYEEIGIGDLRVALRQVGLGGWLSDEALQAFLASGASVKPRVGQVYQLKVNQKLLDEKAVSFGNMIYVPVAAAAQVLHTSLVWDEARQVVTWQNRMAKALQKEKTLYTPLEEMRRLLGGRYTLNRTQRTLELSFPALLFDGQLVTADLLQLGKDYPVPLLAVAKALEQKVTWDAKHEVAKLGCKRIPVNVINGQPYLAADKLSESINAKVVWDDGKETGELVYPVYPIDYSMQLELLADFWD